MALSQTVVSKIVFNAMKGAFNKNDQELNDKRKAFSLKVYRSLVSEENEKQARKLPTGYIYTARSVEVRVPLKQEPKWSCDYLYLTLIFEADMPIPAFLQYDFTMTPEQAKPFIQQAQMLESEAAGISAKREALRDKVRGIVEQASSIKRLLTIWPEAEAYVPTELLTPQKKLPVALPDSLISELKQAKL